MSVVIYFPRKCVQQPIALMHTYVLTGAFIVIAAELRL